MLLEAVRKVREDNEPFLRALSEALREDPDNEATTFSASKTAPPHLGQPLLSPPLMADTSTLFLGVTKEDSSSHWLFPPR